MATAEVKAAEETAIVAAQQTATAAAAAAGATSVPLPALDPRACAERPVSGFGKLWAENGEVRTALGCPRRPEAETAFAVQYYPGGTLYWLGATSTIYVLYNDPDGTWESFDEGDVPEGTPSYPCARSHYLPLVGGGFGKLLAHRSDMADRLGRCALTPEQGGPGAYQEFANGIMLFASATPAPVEGRIWALLDDETFTRHKDTAE